jgi:hypothetical protein
MAKYLVRCEVAYSTIIEADSEEAAIQKAPPAPSRGEWDDPNQPVYEAELYE